MASSPGICDAICSPRPLTFRSRNLAARWFDTLRFERPGKEEAWSYNLLQRLTYLLVIFVLFPLMIWRGLAMSMGFTSAFPLTVRLLGGQQTARTLHFLVTILLVLFLLVHVLMVFVAGFRKPARQAWAKKSIGLHPDQRLANLHS